ncbi:MADS-box protein SOC1 [Glycine soja]|uniref:MADS-box protein SOC1 n=1 Tax=Glycine soja TaxID=3848 RepID=A0A445GAA7_GLYSO|nr:MADS-box protein SOC1 [Glycine soja]
MLQHLKQEAANMMKKIGLLEAAKRKFLGEGLGACSIEELQWIQQQLERSLSNVRARKIQVFKEQIEQLKEKEKVLLDENAKLTENGRLSEKVKLLLFGINSVWPIVHLDNILKQIEAVANYEGDSYMGKPVRINCQKAILMMKCSALFSRPLSTSPNQLDGDKITVATNHKSVNLEGSLLVQHLFKDHRRCSYMIANALDKDGKFTTAQVSRKLKQLDLYLPLPKDGKFTTAQGVLLLN